MIKETSLSVKLKAFTPYPEELVAFAAKICYAKNIDTIDSDPTKEEVQKFVNMLKKSGHTSTFEHVSFTFLIEGVSRAMTHQLVRHRIASYSQRSQRYVSHENFECIIPETIERKKELSVRYRTAFNAISEIYEELLKAGVPKEDARFILPNGCETKILVTMNVRELIHFFSVRLCNRAQWEIRIAAEKMLKQCKEVAPLLFSEVGPRCVSLGFCPEEMSCGKFKEVQKKYKGE